MTDEPRIFMRHVRALGYCAPGAERLAERFNYSYEKFMREGYPVSEARKSSNPMLLKAAALATAEWEKEHADGQKGQ